MNAQVKSIAMRDALLARIRDAMAVDPKVFFATADFGSPIIDDIRSKYADRFVNVGVAEQNLINISSGLAIEGYKVFAYAIAPFITMRCYEQIRVNLCLLGKVRDLNVNLIGVGAGYSYVVSGPTHQCYEDISIMRTLPTIRVLSPSDHTVSAALFDECLTRGIRYIRLDAQVLPVLGDVTLQQLQSGFRQLADFGNRVALVATGYMVHTALDVAAELTKQGISVSVFDIIDLQQKVDAKLLDAFKKSELVVSMEEGFLGRGGVDALLSTAMKASRVSTPLISIGVKPEYNFELGSRTELHEQVGIGRNACMQTVLTALGKGHGQ
jgi:transketolase